MSVQPDMTLSKTAEEVVHFAAIQQVWFAETDPSNRVPRFLPCRVLLVEISSGQFTLMVLSKTHRREVAQVSATLTTGWNICNNEAGYEVKWSASSSLGFAGVGRYMHLRFDDPLTYWDFKRRFADACFQTYRRTRELTEKIKHIGNAETFSRYARMYLGDEYYRQVAEGSPEGHENTSGAVEDGEDGNGRDANGLVERA